MRNPPGYVGTADLSVQFGVTRSAVTEWVRRGHLPGERFEGRVWIPLSALTRFTPPYARSQKRPPPPADPAVEWLTHHQWRQDWSDRRMAVELGIAVKNWSNIKNRRQRLLVKRAQVRARFPEAFAHEVSSPA